MTSECASLTFGRTGKACADGTAVNADTLLAVSDGEPGQSETWSLVTAAVHGTATISHTGMYAGGTFIPSGITYTPAVGYIGMDSFTVRVKDCIDSAATAKVYVTISDCKVGTYPQASPKERGISLYPNPVGDVIHVDGVMQPLTYRLMNMVGSSLLSGTLDNVSNVVDVQHVVSGVYILEVTDAATGMRTTKKIIKQ